MSNINLLPKDLKEREKKVLGKRDNFGLDEIEFTKGEKLKKYPKGKIIKENKFKKWFRPRLSTTDKTKVSVLKQINKEKKLEKKNLKKVKPKKQKIKKSWGKPLKNSTNKKQKIDKNIAGFSNVDTQQTKQKIIIKKDNVKKIKQKKGKGFFNRFKNLFQNKKDKDKKKLNVNLLPAGIYFPGNKTLCSVLLAGFVLSSLLVCIIYFALNLYQMNIISNYKNLQERFEEKLSDIKEYDDLLVEIEDYRIKIQKISELFNRHIYWTKFFKAIEDNTLPTIQYDVFNGSISGNLILTARAPDYKTVAKQWIYLEQANDFVEEVVVDKISLYSDDGDVGIVFSIILDLIEDVFYKK